MMRERHSLAPPQLMDQLYRRKLPHWRTEGATYFVTWRLASEQSRLAPPERDLVAAAMRAFDGQRYRLAAWVVMDDHVHVLLTPLGPWRLKSILHSWKSFTANQMQRAHSRAGRVWQDESFDRIVRNDGELEQKFNYILDNPSRRWPSLDRYSWVWPSD
jgi:REP element-mobilizing transposase RayT